MNTTAVSAQSASFGLHQTEGLTPDGLVLYLQSQLSDIDAKIDRFMEKQRTIQDQRKELNTIANALAGVGAPEEGKTTSKMDSVMRDAFKAAVETLRDEGFDQKFIDQFTDVNLKKLSPEEVEQLKTAVNNTIKDLESSASLDMIQLQSCISQRNTCISLATNLMSALAKGEESIVANIGR